MTALLEHDPAGPDPSTGTGGGGDGGDDDTVAPGGTKRTSLVRRAFMRPRRVLVKVHRWLALTILAWVVVIAATGAWLVEHDAIESWIHPDRYATSGGDLSAAAAYEAGVGALPDDATVYGFTVPRNGRGVYQVYGELALPEDAPADALPDYVTVYVDPGTAEVNAVRNEEEGATNWLYRGHLYLWQDEGIFGVFDQEDGWCRRAPVDADGNRGAEPGGVRGVVCDVIPDGEDMVAYLAVGFIVVLLTGFYLWYWPGVRRWATALVLRRGRGRFTFHMSLHKVVGFVVWGPLLVVAFTGIAFAFPNMNSWFENVTPAQRDFYLWTAPEDAISGEADGREPLGIDEAMAIMEKRYPTRAINYFSVPVEDDETSTYWAWVTRGFDPWTREGGAGNTYLAIDQYTGETLYDGSPEEGNVFDQVWDDWSFPLHTGDFWGTPTRIAWVFLGLSPLVLATTGVVMNLVRRQKRAARRTAA